MGRHWIITSLLAGLLLTEFWPEPTSETGERTPAALAANAANDDPAWEVEQGKPAMVFEAKTSAFRFPSKRERQEAIEWELKPIIANKNRGEIIKILRPVGDEETATFKAWQRRRNTWSKAKDQAMADAETDDAVWARLGNMRAVVDDTYWR